MTGGGLLSPTSRTQGMLATVGSSGKLEQVAVVDVDALVKEVTQGRKAVEAAHSGQGLGHSPSAPAIISQPSQAVAAAAEDDATQGAGNSQSRRGLDSLLAGGGVKSAHDAVPSLPPVDAGAPSSPAAPRESQGRGSARRRTPSPVVMPPARRRRHGIMVGGTNGTPTSASDSGGDTPLSRPTLQPTALPNGDEVFDSSPGDAVTHGEVRSTSPPLNHTLSSPNVLNGRRRAQTQPVGPDSPPTARSTSDSLSGPRRGRHNSPPGPVTSPTPVAPSLVSLGPTASLSGSGVRLGHSASTPSHQPLHGAFSQTSLASRGGGQDASLGVMRPLSTRNSGAAQRFFRFESMDAVAEGSGRALPSTTSLGGSFAGPVGLLFGSNTPSPGNSLPPNNAASYRALRPSVSRRAMRSQASPGSAGGSLASGGAYSPGGFGAGYPRKSGTNSSAGYGGSLASGGSVLGSPMLSQSASAVQLGKVKIATGGGGVAVRTVRRPRSPSARYRSDDAGPPADLSSMLTSSTIMLRQQRGGGGPMSPPPPAGADSSPQQHQQRPDRVRRGNSNERLLKRSNSGNSRGSLGGNSGTPAAVSTALDAAREWDVSPSPSLSPFRTGAPPGDDGAFYGSPHSPHPGWVTSTQLHVMHT